MNMMNEMDYNIWNPLQRHILHFLPFPLPRFHPLITRASLFIFFLILFLSVFHSQRLKSKIISIESPLSTNSMVQSSLRTTMFLCMLLRMSPWYMRPWICNFWPFFCLLVSISAPNSRPCRFYKSQKKVWFWQDTCYQAVST